MKYAILTMTCCVTACSVAPIEGGNFCDIARLLQTTSPELADKIIELDRPFAEDIGTHNANVDECR